MSANQSQINIPGGKSDLPPEKRGIFTQAVIVFGGIVGLIIVMLVIVLLNTDKIFRYNFSILADTFDEIVEKDHALTNAQYAELKKYTIGLHEYVKYGDFKSRAKVTAVQNLTRLFNQVLADKHVDAEELETIRDAMNNSGILNRRREVDASPEAAPDAARAPEKKPAAK